MTKANGIFSWDIKEIASALKITEEDVKNYFTDGRRVSFILERRIAKEILNGKLASNEGKDYDVLDSRGGKWEVRSISKDGIYFCPSYMVGSGRNFDEEGFLKKLDEIDGYIIADIESFPNIPFWIISSSEVRMWWENGKIGKTTKISRKKALNLISEIERYKNER
jgi:hypothetical protein